MLDLTIFRKTGLGLFLSSCDETLSDISTWRDILRSLQFRRRQDCTTSVRQSEVFSCTVVEWTCDSSRDQKPVCVHAIAFVSCVVECHYLVQIIRIPLLWANQKNYDSFHMMEHAPRWGLNYEYVNYSYSVYNVCVLSSRNCHMDLPCQFLLSIPEVWKWKN